MITVGTRVGAVYLDADEKGINLPMITALMWKSRLEEAC